VRAGQLCRIVAVEGPQVVDFNAWNLHNPRERFWAARTKQLHSAHMRVFDRFWSCLPYLRPMATVTGDSVAYGIDEDGAGCHDLLGTRCDPYVHKMLTGEELDVCCHSNLVRAVAPYRLCESDVHDVLNIFQVTGLTEDGHQYFVKPCPARKGDYFEFFAEIDLLCAISTCPHGDMTIPIPTRLRRLVINRAGGRCEYCLIHIPGAIFVRVDKRDGHVWSVQEIEQDYEAMAARLEQETQLPSVA
jgi:hypothetical protein